MRTAIATEKILWVDDGPPALHRTARLRNVATFPSASASNGTETVVWRATDDDGVVRRLPACESATQRWESVVFLVLALAGIVAIGFAVLYTL